MTAFHHIAGEITCGPIWLTDADVEAQLSLALREHDACLRAGDRISARAARAVFLDLTDAVKQRDAWRKAAGVRASDPLKVTTLALGELLQHKTEEAA